VIVKVITTQVLNSKDRVQMEAVLNKRLFSQKHLDDYKGIHLALERWSSKRSYLRGIPVWGPTIGSLDLPMVTSLASQGKKRSLANS
jgi:hypothetical protein